MRKSVLFLVGPTGIGKTELSLALARRLGGEIISADSMLVYRGMDIGTAKPTRAHQRGAPHHLIDLVRPRSNFSVYQYRRRALQAIEEVLKRDRIPLVVGGSGLYLEALWKGLSAPLGENPRLRRKLFEEADRKGLSLLYGQLKRLDPVRARQIHPHDCRRIIRALEIVKLSGKAPSEWYRKRESLEDLGFSVRIFGITRDRAELYERINRRVVRMFRRGFVSEVKRLKRIGFSKTARQALGYREVLEYLRKRRGGVPPPVTEERGDLAPTALVQLIQKRTRQFAKHQLTWFRKEKRIEWILWREGETAQEVCDKIVLRLKNG